MALIEVQNLTKSYKTFKRKEGLKGAFVNLFKREYEFVQAVDNISFHVESGRNSWLHRTQWCWQINDD